jgi:hypothetical protein
MERMPPGQQGWMPEKGSGIFIFALCHKVFLAETETLTAKYQNGENTCFLWCFSFNRQDLGVNFVVSVSCNHLDDWRKEYEHIIKQLLRSLKVKSKARFYVYFRIDLVKNKDVQ